MDYVEIDKNNRAGDEFLNEEEASEIRASIGKLRWLADQTRPDIAYDLLELSIGGHKPTMEMISKINKTVTAVNSRSIELKYSKLCSDKWCLVILH